MHQNYLHSILSVVSKQEQTDGFLGSGREWRRIITDLVLCQDCSGLLSLCHPCQTFIISGSDHQYSAATADCRQYYWATEPLSSYYLHQSTYFISRLRVRTSLESSKDSMATTRLALLSNFLLMFTEEIKTTTILPSHPYQQWMNVCDYLEGFSIKRRRIFFAS